MKRLIRRSLLPIGLGMMLLGQPLLAQTTIDDYNVHHRGSVIGDDVLYSIGGGRAVSMGPVGQMQTLGVGIGWGVGSWLAQAMSKLYAKYFDFPFLVFGVPLSIYALSAMLGLAALLRRRQPWSVH